MNIRFSINCLYLFFEIFLIILKNSIIEKIQNINNNKSKIKL